MKITLDIKKLNRYVTSITGHAGLQMDQYEKMVCDEDRWPLLRPMYEVAVGDIESTFASKLKSSRLTTSIQYYGETGTTDQSIELSSGSITIELDDYKISRLSDATVNLVKSQIELAVVYALCYQWFRTFNADLSKTFADQAYSHTINAIDALSVKNVRADMSEANSDDVEMHDEPASATMSASNSDDVEMHDEAAQSIFEEPIDDVVPIKKERLFHSCIVETEHKPFMI